MLIIVLFDKALHGIYVQKIEYMTSYLFAWIIWVIVYLCVWKIGCYKEHMISLLELKRLSLLIMITLLSTSWSLHLLLNHLNLLSSLLNNLWSKHNTLSRFILSQRSHTPPFIQSLIKCHSNTIMIIVIVGELDQWKVTIPDTSLFQNIISQHIFQILYGYFHLTIHLRMVGRT